MKLKFDSKWIFLSMGMYLLLRIVEYVSGQTGSPEWAVDLMPFWLPLGFWLFDNMFDNMFTKHKEKAP